MCDMKSVYDMNFNGMKSALLLLVLVVLPAMSKAVSYTWTGASSTSWSVNGNWSPSTGYPDIGDDATITSAGFSPVFEEIIGIVNFTMTSGTLNLSGFDLQISGTGTFNGGTITNGGAVGVICLGNSSFAGTTFSTKVAVSGTSTAFNGGTFNNPVTVTKTSSSAVTFNGGNTFNSTFALTNSGSGDIILANINPDTYVGNVTLTNSGTGFIYASHIATGTAYQGNITFNSTGSSAGIRIGQGGGTSTLSSTRTLNVGGTGFSTGELTLKNFTQSGSTAQSLTFTGTAILTLEAGTIFNGAVILTSPQVFLNGATFESTASITKSGAGTNFSSGGNTFKGATTIIHSGSADMQLAVSNPDAFQSTVTFTNSGSQFLMVANGASGNTFSQNITINSNGSSKGIRFGFSGGSSTLASGRTISVGIGGYTTGSLRLKNFTQTGSTAQTISLSSGTALLWLESGTTFNGNVTFKFPQVRLDGAVFNGNATIEKAGATSNTSNGGNTFNGTARITNSGSAVLTLGNTSADIFQSSVEFIASGSSNIQVAQAGAGTQFNGPLIVNSSGSASGVRFGQNGGTSTLASGQQITIGAGGFSIGALMLRGFVQNGGTAQSLIDFSDDASLHLQAGTQFNGAITFTAPQVYLNGFTANGDALITQTGVLSTICDGGNTFAGNMTLAKTGTGEWVLGNSNPDIFNGNLSIENTDDEVIYLAEASSGNEFNGNIQLNSTGTGGGIRFGQNGGAARLASTKTISIGSSGFNSGDLRISSLTQNGSTSQSLTTFGSGVEVYLEGGTTFNGNLTLTAPGIYLQGTTFNGTTAITKTGTSPNISAGGNIFNAATTIAATGSGAMYLAGSAGDDFNEDVSFLQTTSFTLYPAYNVNSTFAKDILTTGSSTAVIFASSGGTVTMNGTGSQNISGDISKAPEFGTLTINKASNHVRLNVPVYVTGNLTLTSGRIISSNTNVLVIVDNATVSGVSSNSYVSGPVRKEGNDAFMFPVGNGGYYRPIGISAPSTVGSHFVGEFFLADSDGTYPHSSRDVTLDHLSHCEFWDLARTAGASSTVVTLSWNSSSCGVTQLSDLKVARWDGSMWKDLGNGGTTGNTSVGTIASSAPVGGFSPFTLSSSTAENPLPVNLVYFEAKPDKDRVLLNWTTVSETSNDYFSIESSLDAENFEEVCRVSGAGNSNTTLQYSTFDNRPYRGVSYYRLKQVDFNGKIMYSGIKVVNMPTLWENEMVVSPNPTLGNIFVRLDPEVFTKVDIELRDLQGRIVFEKKECEVDVQNPLNIDLTSFPQGVYFLNAAGNGKNVVKRVIKN